MVMSVMAACYGCGRLFQFNPDYVPSIRPPRWIPVNLLGLASVFSIPSETREPVCRTCIEAANPRRVAGGLEPIPIHPLAYEPTEEY